MAAGADDKGTGSEADADLEPVPKLPRGRGLKLDGPMLFRIGATLILLIAVVVMRKPCADATSKFVTGFGDEGSGSVVKPGTVDLPPPTGSGSSAGSGQMEYVGGGASDEEVRAAWERAKAKARAEQGSAAEGSGSAGSAAGSGSTTGSGGSGTR